MIIKGIQDEVFGDYKKPSMYIAFPYCTFKCDKENGCQMCQNLDLALSKNIEISYQEIVERYLSNPITKAILFAGLEPFDSYIDVQALVEEIRIRRECQDDIVIYTGYTEEEMEDSRWLMNTAYQRLKDFDNIIVKFGRFRPNQEPHYDETLGIKLASNNQYAKRIGQ